MSRRRSGESGKPRPKKPRRRPEPEVTYVEHPRFGSRPRLTGLDVTHILYGGEAILRWQRDIEGRRMIRGTAVPADLERQTPATLPVTHYYDEEHTCRDCGRPFLFFAVEQKHWYEELGFPLEADCLRCFPCRKKEREIEALHARYQELVRQDGLAPEQEAELALLRLDLIEAAVFTDKQADHVRAFLNRHPDHPQALAMRERLSQLAQRDR